MLGQSHRRPTIGHPLTASYAGILEPFGAAINLDAKTQTDLHVWGSSALQLTVDADDAATAGYPYHVIVGLKNVADVPVYNATIELLKEGKRNYIYQPRQPLTISADTIEPGQTLKRDYILVPTITGQLDLSDSFASESAGATQLPSTITSHPPIDPPASAPAITATNLNGKVGLRWQPVPGATSYAVYSTSDPSIDFPDTPAPNVDTLPNDDDGSMRAVVRNVSADTKNYYAISPIIDGEPLMSHPLV